MRIIHRTSEKKTFSIPTIALYGFQKEKIEREKKVKNIFGEIIAENFPNLKEESYI